MISGGGGGGLALPSFGPAITLTSCNINLNELLFVGKWQHKLNCNL